MAAFFFWGSWVCGAKRPEKDYSYTHNWPSDPLAGNSITKESYIWSLVASITMILLTGKLLFAHGRRNKFVDNTTTEEMEEKINLKKFIPTQTQTAIGKFLVVAMTLFFI